MTCFCQSISPPLNEFKVGYKLETYDPRNTSSTCIATVIEIAGPRLRLRLDGTDDRNDFWLMCDSDQLHPFEHAARNGRKISPPLGFGNELSKWPKFLERIIHSAGGEKGLFAPETCFASTPPAKPPRNEFKPGQKLEAVDPKNPHLICPATVRDVNRDKIFVLFDGWSQASQFWVSYTSRDIFPVGWCKRVGHDLQMPGDLKEEKHLIPNQNNRRISSSNLANTNGVQQPTTNPKTLNRRSSKVQNSSTKKLKRQSTTDLNRTHNSSTSSANSSHLNITADTTGYDNSKNVLTNGVNKLEGGFDLCLVKTEAIDPSETDFGNSNKFYETTNIFKSDSVNKLHNSNSIIFVFSFLYDSQFLHISVFCIVIVYVNPSADCGTLIKTVKFHKTHTKFGPGTPASVYKSIIQTFVDCAFNRLELFNMVPEGKSNQYIKRKKI